MAEDRGTTLGLSSKANNISLYTVDATFHSSTSSIILTKLSGANSRPTTSQKIW
jgi:hypothetical protein